MSSEKKQFKILLLVPDFKPPETSGTWYSRVFPRIVSGEIKPSTNSRMECYCDVCDGTFAGMYWDHQKNVHMREREVVLKEMRAAQDKG